MVEEKYIAKIKKEIKSHLNAIEKLKRLIPWGVLTMTLLGFIYPIVPRNNGTLAEWMGYPYAVIMMLILGGIVYLIGYKIAIKKRNEEIAKLEDKLKTYNFNNETSSGQKKDDNIV